jgi:outer membrane lipoprotein SlyB
MKILAAIAAAAVLGMAGAASADTMENSFGNTITVTTADGHNIIYLVNADHSYAMNAGDTHVNGTWAVKGDQVCLTPQGGQETCTPYDASRNVGDTWTQTGSDGAQITIKITAGR